MVFSSTIFMFLFLPLTILCYYGLPRRRNFILVLASLIFYAWGAPKFIVLLVANITIDYILALLIHKEPRKMLRKALFVFSIVINLGLLIYYKYSNFFIGQINSLSDVHFQWTEVVLPIGISFFIFHKISYIVDIYRGTKSPFASLPDMFLYIMFFPQLIAGPIVRFHEIADQIISRTHTVDRFFEGSWRFALGLGKKVIIANTLGVHADAVFNAPVTELSFISAWTGVLCYTFQIYFDFSGYSDMAIGLGKMFGFELPENFNRPYISASITEFWRRWHMSLSRFFKDYLYLPLGGNRVSHFRTYLNLWTVFFLCGLWHGANWTFVVWGLYHGFLLVLDKWFLLKQLDRFPIAFRNIVTFMLVVIGWVFFRSESITYSLNFLKSMFSNPFNTPIVLTMNDKMVVIFIIAVLLSFARVKFNYPISETYFPIVKGLVMLLITIFSTCIIATGSFNPFIYFQF